MAERALINAARYGDYEAAESILEEGMDVNARDEVSEAVCVP